MQLLLKGLCAYMQAQQAGSSAAQALPWLVVVGSVLLQVMGLSCQSAAMYSDATHDRGILSFLASLSAPFALQALLWWLPAAWALRFFGHDSSAASAKARDSGSVAVTSMRWSDYTVMLQWDPRSVVTANELAEWATQYGEASLCIQRGLDNGSRSGSAKLQADQA